jgi:hypothetical protein
MKKVKENKDKDFKTIKNYKIKEKNILKMFNYIKKQENGN